MVKKSTGKKEAKFSQSEEIEQLKAELAQAREKEARALADYQNLLRRSSEERSRFVKLANVDLITALLQPLGHLSLAAKQIKDQGLDMVINQLWQELSEFGLKEIDVLGSKFDVELMEAVESRGNGEKVIEIVRPAYSLNGQIIQHAQVILG